MGLQSLRLHNFKSYAGDIVLELDGAAFVSVVGPNGSGKSNLLDAVCFVLGMPPSQLRCASLIELCHTGAAKMFVEATVNVYGHVQVFRRTPSACFVDGTRVTSDIYAQRWARLNVFPELMNTVVLQGDIEKLAGAAPPQLASMVESLEAVESTQAETDFADLRREYDVARAALARARAAAHAQASEHTDAREAADEYRQLRSARARHDRLTSELSSAKAQRADLIERAHLAKLAGLRRAVKEARINLADARSEARLVSHDSKALRSDYARRRRGMQAARAQEAEARAVLARTEGEHAPLAHRVEALAAEQRVLAPDAEFAHESLRAAQAELAGVDRALTLLTRADAQSRAEDERAIGAAPELRELWTRLEAEFRLEHESELDGIAAAQRDVDSSRLAFESLDVAVAAQVDARDAAALRVRELEAAVQRADALVDERGARAAATRAQLERVSSELASVRADIAELQPRLVESTQKLQRAGGNRAVMDKRRRMLDAIDRMRRSCPGVRDLLGNVVSAQETQFDAALERALGPHSDAVVVDSSETALKCAQLVREQRLGAFTFMPVADLDVRGVDTALRARLRTSGVTGARLLVDSVSVDSANRPAAAYALGDAVVVPDIDGALRLRELGIRVRLITHDGSVLSANNLMSVMPGMASSAASDRAITTLTRKAGQLAERLKAASLREPDLIDEEAELTSRIDAGMSSQETARHDAIVAKEQLASAQREADHLAEPVEAESQRAQALQSLEQAEDRLKAIQAQVHAIKEKFFAPFVAEAGGSLVDWEPVFARSSTRHAELERERAALLTRKASAQRRVDTARDVVTDVEKREQALKGAHAAAAAELADLEAAMRAATAKLERAGARLRDLKAEAESKSDQVGQAEAAMDEANERLEEAEQAERRAKADLAAERMVDRLRKKANLDSAGNADMEAVRNEEDVHMSAPESSDESDDGSDDDDASDNEPEDDPVVPSADNASANSAVLSVQLVEDRIREIEAELQVLNVSEDFEDYLSQAAERYSQLNEEAAAHRNDSDELRERLEGIRRRRAAKFDAALFQLQEGLNEVYGELVGVGAQAVLTPVNPDEPFEGVEFAIMAPGKPFAPVSQLSGGERSMAALALLFTCQRLRPAPFVVLDEVDAALDFVNVANVASYIRSHSRATQYIVVSLKQRLYQRAGHLVGVYKREQRSQLLTVAL